MKFQKIIIIIASKTVFFPHCLYILTLRYRTKVNRYTKI